MDDEWGSSDLFANGPDEQQWNIPNQQYNISDSNTPTSMEQFNYLGDQYQTSGNDFGGNISNSPEQGWQEQGTNWGYVDQQLGSTFNSPLQQVYDAGQGAMGGTQNFLAQLFGSNGKAGGGRNPWVQGLGAVVEGMQNKKKQAAIQQLVAQQQQRTDPFGSQRGQYQQALSSTIQDPYNQPMVKDQVAQIARAQAIKDAAAGRRSNSATSDPAMLAAQAQIAQQYMNSLMQPAGANIAPSSVGLQELLSGVNSGVNGWMSPAMSALGYNSASSQNTDKMDALRKFLSGGN